MSTGVEPGTAPRVLAIGRPATATGRVPASGALHRAEIGLRGPAHAPRARWLGSAGSFGLALLVLSVFGIVYLAQISNVARLGYRLSDMQRQQAKLESENELLQYRLSSERTLARASDIADQQYGMQPFTGVSQSTTTPAAASRTTANTAGMAAPRVRFITARHLAPAAAPTPVAPSPSTLADRLWNRIIGIGTAGAATP